MIAHSIQIIELSQSFGGVSVVSLMGGAIPPTSEYFGVISGRYGTIPYIPTYAGRRSVFVRFSLVRRVRGTSHFPLTLYSLRFHQLDVENYAKAKSCDNTSRTLRSILTGLWFPQRQL